MMATNVSTILLSLGALSEIARADISALAEAMTVSEVGLAHYVHGLSSESS